MSEIEQMRIKKRTDNILHDHHKSNPSRRGASTAADGSPVRIVG